MKFLQRLLSGVFVSLQTVWGLLKIHFGYFWTFIQQEVDVASIQQGIFRFGPPSCLDEAIADPCDREWMVRSHCCTSWDVLGDLLTEDWSGQFHPNHSWSSASCLVMDLPFSCKHGHRLIFANLHVMGFHAILNKQIELAVRSLISKLGETCFLSVSFLILMFCPCSLGYRHVWFGQPVNPMAVERSLRPVPSRNIKRKTHKKRGAANDQPPHVVNPWIQSLQYILN